MNEQQEFHGYNTDGEYQGLIVATPEQMADMGLTAGDAPMVSDPPDPVIAWRETRSIDLAPFCINLLTAGVLSAESAVLAASCGWPAEFDAFLNDKTPEEKAVIKITWAGAYTVKRSHPFIAGLQQLNPTVLTDDFVDTQLFGWVTPQTS